MAKSTWSQAKQCTLFTVLAILLSHSGSFSQTDAFLGYGEDCQEGECLGTDMCPEKSFHPGVSKTQAGSEPTNHGRDGSSIDRAQMQSQQLEHLIAKQQEHLEQLESLLRKLDENVCKLENEILGHLRKSGDIETGISTARRIVEPGNRAIFDHDGMSTIKGYGSGGEQSQVAALRPTGTEVYENEKQIDATSRLGVESPLQSSRTKRDAADVGQGRGGGMTIARYKPAWSEHFQFLSAVKIDGEVTCLHVLPQEGYEGLSMYIAVGDETGRVYVFLSHGDLLVDFSTISRQAVTAMLSFSPLKNETMLLTGHSDGTVLVHKIWETTDSGSSREDNWPALSIEYLQSLVSPKTKTQMPSDESDFRGKLDAAVSPVTILEVYRVGKMRYILVSDADGKIQVFRENGTFYGVANSSSRPLAFLRSSNTQRLLFLTEDGAASLDLRSMTVRTGHCEGLNGSKVVAYAFDAAGRSKAYGFSAEGQMVYVALSGDTVHFECHVRSKKKLDFEGPVAPYAIKGYLLVATPTEILVYNTTLHTYTSLPMGIPRPLFTAALEEISSTFFNTPIPSISCPVMASNRDRLVALGFADGYVGIYKSNLPVQKPAHFNEKIWTSPVFIAVMIMFGGWYFMGKKRDVPLGLNADTDAALASSSVSTPAYMRLGDQLETLMESRHISSPSEAFPSNTSGYSSGSMKFRSPIVEESLRTSVEPKFRGSTSEPVFRSPTVEPGFRSATVERSPYPSRRESLFAKPPSMVNEHLQ